MNSDQTSQPPTSSACTSLNLRRASRAASQFLESYLQPLGLHSGQFGILSALSRAGSTSITLLAEEMSLDRTTLTRSLQILRRDGLICVACGEDKRVREVVLTPKGREVLAEAIPLWQKAEAALAETLGPERQRDLRSCLESLSKLERD